MDVKRLADLADDLFTKKSPLNTLHQEISQNFFPERADFTVTRSLGTDFASDLYSSYPVQCRRDLGNNFGTMLRPTAKPWFHGKRRHVEREGEDHETKTWLEHFDQVQRRVMYHPDAMFTRATKEGDHDFAAFGQTAISVELNKLANGLLYRCWHLRDLAWQENEEGKIGFVARRWKAPALTLKRTFRNLHKQVLDDVEKQPFNETNVLHLVVEADMYDDKTQCPRWSIFYDRDHDHVMSATPIWGKYYVIPRWQTVSGSQYSYSPATVCALPDGRLLQAMTFTLLEASEKAASPPMIATQNAVRSDLALYANGVTWVDEEYDERLGAALRPIEQDFRGMQYGVAMAQNTQMMLHRAFFLDKLNMPERAPEMTAYEVGQRVQEYIRNALPIFEPMEMEYSAGLCEESRGLIYRAGGFGSPTEWPKKLRAFFDDADFDFESPLHDAIEQQKGQKFQEAQALIGSAIALDPSCGFVPRAEVALRDALSGIGVPANWMNNEAFVQDAKNAKAANDAREAQLQQIAVASGAAKDIGQSGLVPAAA